MPSKVSRHTRHRENSMMPVRLGESIPDLATVQLELDEMTDVLLGRVDPPIDHGSSTLLEVASAYYARALELNAVLHRAEANGEVLKNSLPYKFRTGELKDFLELAHSRCNTGQRRISVELKELEAERFGA